MPRSTPAPADDKNRIQTYRKMMDVLECFTAVDRQLPLAQIADEADLPRATTHRILTALKEIGFIEQDNRRGNYGLGLRLFELGSLTLANMDLLREAKPFVDRLARLAEESAHLGVFNGLEVVVVEREEHPGRGSRSSRPIEAAPAYCTGVGKAVLAFQPQNAIDRVVAAGLKPFTRNTITSPSGLHQELSRIRAQGFAIDDAEHQEFVRCVAAPIRNSNAAVFAAISVTGPATRMTVERCTLLSAPVIQAAESISRQLGYALPL